MEGLVRFLFSLISITIFTFGWQSATRLPIWAERNQFSCDQKYIERRISHTVKFSCGMVLCLFPFERLNEKLKRYNVNVGSTAKNEGKNEGVEFYTRYQRQNISLNCKSRHIVRSYWERERRLRLQLVEIASFPPKEGHFKNQNNKHSPQHSEHRVIENSTCVESLACIEMRSH